MMKKSCLFIFTFAGLFSFSQLCAGVSGSATITLRPSHVSIISDTSEGAVLVTLTRYQYKDVRYRLFNGSDQYACWDKLTNSFIMPASYSLGPLVPGNPTDSSVFWIIYRRGKNKSTTASYRDRVGPEYSSNNKTIALPAAVAIEDSFFLSGKIGGTEINGLDQKYVVLAWQGITLVSVGSSDLESGFFSIILPSGVIIDKMEVRTVDNISVADLKGYWATSEDLPVIQIADNPVQDAKLCKIMMDGVDLPGFNPNIFVYNVELPEETITPPIIEATSCNNNSSIFQIQAEDLNGGPDSRTTRIIITAPDGKTTKTYIILFIPLTGVSTLREFRTGDTTRIYLIKSELLITYLNTFRNQKYIQDSTGAVIIDDPSNIISTKYRIGDLISNLKCKLQLKNSQIELIPCADPGVALSSGNLLIPELVTIKDLNTGIGRYDNKFVKIAKVRPDDAGTIVIANTTYQVSDGENWAFINTKYSDLDYIGISLPRLCDISGIAASVNGEVQIIPRFVSDFYIYSRDACLNKITINGTLLPGFNPDILSYVYSLPAATNKIPEVTYTTRNNKSSVILTNSTDINGTEAARTSTITVLAEDRNTEKVYTIIFRKEYFTGIEIHPDTDIQVYPIPVYDEMTINGLKKFSNLYVIDFTGKIIIHVKNTDEKVILNLCQLVPGIYFIRANDKTLKFVKQ